MALFFKLSLYMGQHIEMKNPRYFPKGIFVLLQAVFGRSELESTTTGCKRKKKKTLIPELRKGYLIWVKYSHRRSAAFKDFFFFLGKIKENGRRCEITQKAKDRMGEGVVEIMMRRNRT